MHATAAVQKTLKPPSLRKSIIGLGKKELIAEAAKIGPLHEAATKREVMGVMAHVETRGKVAGRSALAIKGMEFVESGTLVLSKEFDALEVDGRYQRGEQSSVVNAMAYALRLGGSSLAPIVLVRRRWRDVGTKPGVRYILDGQQRILAHLSAGLDEVTYVLYESENLDAEKRAFSILNMTSRKVSGNEIVRSLGGSACSLIVAADADQDHPLFRRIQWHAQGRTSATGNIGALMTLKGVGIALGATAGNNATQMSPAYLVPRLDAKFERRKADVFLRTLAHCVPMGAEHRAVQLFVFALAQVCGERWTVGIPVAPTPQQCASLARVNWIKVTEGARALAFTSVLRERIKKIWK